MDNSLKRSLTPLIYFFLARNLKQQRTTTGTAFPAVPVVVLCVYHFTIKDFNFRHEMS